MLSGRFTFIVLLVSELELDGSPLRGVARSAWISPVLVSKAISLRRIKQFSPNGAFDNRFGVTSPFHSSSERADVKLIETTRNLSDMAC